MFNAEMDLQATDDVYEQSDDGENHDEPSDHDTGSFKIEPSPNTRLTMYYAIVTAEAKEEEDVVANGASLHTLAHKFGPRATQLRYVDFPYYYSYTNKDGWKRKRNRDYGKTIVRVHGVPGKDPELWYLRLLLNNVKGVRSQQYLLDAVLYNGTRCTTFHQACLARGLAKDDQEWYQCLFEASRVDGKCGKSLRTLYTTIFAFCSPSDPVGLFHAFKDDFADDFAYIRNHDQQTASILSVDHYRALLWIHEKLTNDMSQPALIMGCLTNMLNAWNKEDKATVENDGPQMRAVSIRTILFTPTKKTNVSVYVDHVCPYTADHRGGGSVRGHSYSRSKKYIGPRRQSGPRRYAYYFLSRSTRYRNYSTFHVFHLCS